MSNISHREIDDKSSLRGVGRVSSAASHSKYDRTKGAGYVAACDGQYADALSRNIGVSLLLVETTSTTHQCARRRFHDNPPHPREAGVTSWRH